MTLPFQELVDAAIAEGRMKRVPVGDTGRPAKVKPDGRPPQVRPETCGSGFQVPRHQFLDEADGEFS